MQRRNTHQRQLILDAVRARGDHPTADDIYLDVRAIDNRVSRGTVYRNLKILEQAREIQAVRMAGGDHFDRRVDDHAHAVCRECGQVIDVPIPHDRKLNDEAAEKTGFAIDSHQTVFSGLCPDCQARHATEGTGMTDDSVSSLLPSPAPRMPQE